MFIMVDGRKLTKSVTSDDIVLLPRHVSMISLFCLFLLLEMKHLWSFDFQVVQHPSSGRNVCTSSTGRAHPRITSLAIFSKHIWETVFRFTSLGMYNLLKPIEWLP